MRYPKGLIQDFDTETLITSYSERITYNDLAVDSSPLPLFKIHVPLNATNPVLICPFMYLVDILYMADVHDVETDELIETGFTKIKLVFFINDADFYWTVRSKTDFNFDQDEKTFTGRSIIRFLNPLFDKTNDELTIQMQNSSGTSTFDNIAFIAKGVLRNQVAFIKYSHNASMEVRFAGDITINNKLIISEAKPIYFDKDTELHALFNMFQFCRTTQKLINIAENVIVTTKEIILEDFSPQIIDLSANSSLIFGDGTTIELGKNEDLTMTWTFHGACILNGKGQTLTLGQLGKIVVDGHGSSLLLDNITIKGVSSNNICCLDNSCTISFRCTKLVLGNDFFFGTGRFVVLDQLKIGGHKTFEYSTDKQSIITSDSCLLLDRNCNFFYNPSAADRTLLKFDNESSLLQLNGASLSVSTTGLDLSLGTLSIKNKCFLHNNGAHCLSEGIIVNSIDIFAGGSLDLKSGILDYRNNA